ncbi:MAG TPA: PAS domain-containing sensor histidine kinase [Candidatus Binatia bacterium]|jgi:signal transduction histidine kinase|nr:PAS domain-containing sensor histidine kinase [Candidatus Binatia bacterium]
MGRPAAVPASTALRPEPSSVADTTSLLLRGGRDGGRYVLFLVDADGIVLTASESCATLLRWQPDDVIGMPLEAIVRAPERHDAPFQARRRDGSRLPCELTTWALGDGRYTAVVRDLTGRQETERALREEVEIAGALLHLGETLNSHLDEPYILDWVNTMALKLLGCDWSSVLGWDAKRRRYRFFASAGAVRPDVHELLAEIALAPDELPLLRVLEPGTVIELADTADQDLMPSSLFATLGLTSAVCVPICRRRDIVGILLHGYRSRSAPLSPRESRLAQGIAQATAVALDNAFLIADLQTASRLKSEFLTTLSHELRTPLNVITGYGEMLADGAQGALTAEQAASLAAIRRSALQLTDLIEGTLDLGHLDDGSDRVACDPVELAEVFAAIESDVAPLVPPGVTLSWPSVPSRPLRLDRRKVRAVVKHLVTNGLKFTSAGTVAVDATVADGILTLTVRDSGVGIAPDDVPVIFDRFRQVDGSNTRRFGGMGLGLHIVKRLVQVLQGSVRVESVLGVGSTFVVTLPIDG